MRILYLLITFVCSTVLSVACRADVLVTKHECNGTSSTLTFLSNTLVDVGDVTSTCRVWIRTTIATDVIGSLKLTGTPSNEVAVHITGLDYFPALINDNTNGIIVTASNWNGIDVGTSSAVLDKLSLAVIISGSITGRVEANTIFVVRSSSAIAATDLIARGEGYISSETVINFVRGANISSNINTLQGGVFQVESSNGSITGNIILSNGSIDSILAATTIGVPTQLPVVISAKNIRSVTAQRMHAVITADPIDGTIEQVRTTAAGVNSFKGRVSAARIAPFTTLPAISKGIDIAGDLEVPATSGQAAIEVQELTLFVNVSLQS